MRGGVNAAFTGSASGRNVIARSPCTAFRAAARCGRRDGAVRALENQWSPLPARILRRSRVRGDVFVWEKAQAQFADRASALLKSNAHCVRHTAPMTVGSGRSAVNPDLGPAFHERSEDRDGGVGREREGWPGGEADVSAWRMDRDRNAWISRSKRRREDRG